jgi:DNA-directed RNA polymerase specialized sigma24 family protein
MIQPMFSHASDQLNPIQRKTEYCVMHSARSSEPFRELTMISQAERNTSWWHSAQPSEPFRELTMISQAEEEYELFRQAILFREEDAWAAIYARYHSLLVSWAYHSGAQQCMELPSDIADRALARAWVALTPDRFAEFPSLASLLSYLRTCVKTTAIDLARSQAASDRAWQQIDAGEPATPEQIITDKLDRDALWNMVIAQAHTPAEQIALIESCVYGLPPRAIHARHPDRFPTVDSVYTTKRNLFNRLQRNPDVLRLRDAFAL